MRACLPWRMKFLRFCIVLMMANIQMLDTGYQMLEGLIAISLRDETKDYYRLDESKKSQRERRREEEKRNKRRRNLERQERGAR